MTEISRAGTAAKALFEHLPGHVIVEISHEYSLWAERSKHETVTRRFTRA